ncbi:MAG: HlyD family efflux transporter periplasmic adaptor subunit [Hydrotalea flava]|uniref:efflux RND transporter periplasmic adaptor subunit n=1 Tax=Hydrotalea lipotrueae TaxID=2803817 RepID=UPI0016A8387C|nr:efflux RND transporter periplasmic adaptor subunit [Hydrotalea lipotrueae]NIM34529.1 HlyD family efflux transporter periplasmic adaptor subunit [Hydrotalea flava]NIM37369.1 HlyD family efflux transporter periplasmic adaptor subunit [Hydrotalea flava]NIN02554.1 HlyD family efflux transporter periplasmic adaptor subunit [Hydrotalea flava]NIN14214.1 HlyD family efflux transporter periplasmic adaptor subunit [Hydrotalea flava]NIO93295.1 HlyD family efflux transporter periplasmic adaptor subunit
MYSKIIVCIAFVLLVACQPKKGSIYPQQENITEAVYASGMVKSDRQYEAFATVTGLIDTIYVTEGELVKKGQPILHIVNTATRLNTENAALVAANASVAANAARLNEAKISIANAKAQLDNATTLLQRQRNLWAQQIGAKNDLDQRELAYTNALHAWQAAQLQYDDLKKQIDFSAQQAQKNLAIAGTAKNDYTVKSDVDGMVFQLNKKKGELVSPQTALALVGAAHQFLLELQIDEHDIARIHNGMQVLYTMDSYNGKVFEAKVVKIYPAMDEHSRTFKVDAALVQSPPVLYPNLTLEANIVIRQQQNAITIPANYLLPGDSVLLANGKKQKVVVGIKDYQKIEIVSGITTKDELME